MKMNAGGENYDKKNRFSDGPYTFCVSVPSGLYEISTDEGLSDHRTGTRAGRGVERKISGV